MTPLPDKHDSLFNIAFRQISEVPGEGWLYALVAALLTVGTDLSLWASGRTARPTDLLWAIITVPASLASTYAIAMMLLRAKPSVRGFGGFIAASIALLTPMVVGITFLLVGKGVFAPSATLTAFFVPAGISIALLTFLPAWPVAQSQASHFVSPVRIFKATRGSRWSLVMLAVVTSSLGRSDLIPAVGKARNVLEALTYGSGHVVIDAFVTLLNASIAVAALSFAIRRDPELKNELSRQG